MKSRFFLRNRIILGGDLFLIAVSVLASFVLRLNFGARLADFQAQIAAMILIAWIVKPLVYTLFGLYRRVWVYASVQELKLVAVAVTAASVVMFAAISVIQALRVFPEFPRAAVFIDYPISLMCVGGLRFALRVLAESRGADLGNGHTAAKRALVVGAGDAGALVVREMQKNPAGLTPVCFVDDDPAKQKQEIHSVPVVGRLDDLTQVIERYGIQEVIIAIPSASGQVVRRVAEACRQKSTPFRTMPSLFELIGGKVSVNRLREVDIADLLRRQPAKIDEALIGHSLSGRRVLVTGAGGSIGRELCRQTARWGPQELVLLGHGENSIFETMLELNENFPGLALHAVIADIRDTRRLNDIFAQFRPQVVFHTAAHKHVPLMETLSNVEEAVTNNILGTRNVVAAAQRSQVQRLVMISTDKAVQPSSVYGATKRIAEMLVITGAQAQRDITMQHNFTVVRFGNVLGSRGSIVPRFKRQIAAGGPVTVTHPEMMRYFMTIPEAVHLVLQAAAMGQGGEIFALNMGEQVNILELAEDLIRLSGLEPGRDIEITFTGIRPGEKLREALWDEGAAYQPTSHPDIIHLEEEQALNVLELEEVVQSLEKLCGGGNLPVSANPNPDYEQQREAILDILGHSIPGAALQSAPPPDLTAVV